MEKLTIQELMSKYSEIVKELKRRGVLRTNNFIGDVGEYRGIEILNSEFNNLNLTIAPPGTANYDSIDINTKMRYSIKSISSLATSIIDRTNVLDTDGPVIKIFDFLVIVKFDREDFSIEQIYLLNWNTYIRHRKWHSTMNGWYVTITQSFVNDPNVIKVLQR